MSHLRLVLAAAAGAVVLAALAIPGAHYYYRASWGEGCARCHEIRGNYKSWQHSSHRKVNCVQCHESSLESSVRRVVRHVRGDVPDRIHLGMTDVVNMVDKCRNCHQQEFAQWRSGPHATTFARIFLDPDHNRKRQLMDDCLRCHGMHFPGGIQEVVTPVNTKGPWTLKNPKMVNWPAIPCLACHSVHRQGETLPRAGTRLGPRQEVFRPSIALHDRRSQLPIALALLPLPPMLEGTRPVKMSPDQRQTLCYQCHSPLASRQIGTGDDRTPIGVHEGLSCLACHQKHGMMTHASCSGCHPRLSNCGLDVEKMDTTFLSPNSRHDIHRVKCVDCHPKRVPRPRTRIQTD